MEKVSGWRVGQDMDMACFSFNLNSSQMRHWLWSIMAKKKERRNKRSACLPSKDKRNNWKKKLGPGNWKVMGRVTLYNSFDFQCHEHCIFACMKAVDENSGYKVWPLLNVIQDFRWVIMHAMIHDIRSPESWERSNFFRTMMDRGDTSPRKSLLIGSSESTRLCNAIVGKMVDRRLGLVTRVLTVWQAELMLLWGQPHVRTHDCFIAF